MAAIVSSHYATELDDSGAPHRLIADKILLVVWLARAGGRIDGP